MNEFKFKFCHPDVLNLLRDIAAMFVFLIHGLTLFPNEGKVNEVCFLAYTPGCAGVWIFVFISSYLLSLGFDNGRYSIRDIDGNISIKEISNFYLKRFLRIAPIYYFYCIAFEFFTNNTLFWSNPIVALRIVTFTFNGTGGIDGIGHLWYLSLAMQIYLLLPWIYIIVEKTWKRGKGKYIVLLALIGGVVERLILYYFNLDWNTWVYTFVLSNLDIVICGSALALFKAHNIMKQYNKVVYLFCNIQFLCLAVYNCWIYYSGQERGIAVYLIIYMYILPTVYIISCSILIIMYHDINKMFKASKNKKVNFVDWFSKYTFDFYVLHIQSIIYIRLTIAQLRIFTEGTVFVKYIIFIGGSFLLTMGGAVVLHYAVKGLNIGIKRACNSIS